MTGHSVEIVSDFIVGGYTAECSCGWASERYHTTAEALAASEMHQDAAADRLFLDLKGALERLCRAQTNMPAWWRADAQQAIVIVQMIGSGVCPGRWSKHDQPEYGEAT